MQDRTHWLIEVLRVTSDAHFQASQAQAPADLLGEYENVIKQTCTALSAVIENSTSELQKVMRGQH